MTAPVLPKNLVDGPVRIGLPFGLFSVLAPRENGRFDTGVQWEPMTCDGLSGLELIPEFCDDGSMLGSTTKDLSHSCPDKGEATPFVIYGHATRTPITSSFADLQAQAVTHLETREEQAVESALWSGTYGNDPNFTTAVSLGTYGYAAEVHALSDLEEKFAQDYGSQGVLHMGRSHALRLLTKGAIDVRGGRLFTVLGTPVVAGTGYDEGSIVATSQLIGYRSEIFPNVPAEQAFDRGQNDFYGLAERTYLIGFDPCTVLSVEFEDDEGFTHPSDGA